MPLTIYVKIHKYIGNLKELSSESFSKLQSTLKPNQTKQNEPSISHLEVESREGKMYVDLASTPKSEAACEKCKKIIRNENKTQYYKDWTNSTSRKWEQ